MKLVVCVTKHFVGSNIFMEEACFIATSKEANILLTNNGAVKLSDFGCAAQSNANNDDVIVGTACFLAPEVAAVERKGAYNYLCDIWSTGITAIGKCASSSFVDFAFSIQYFIFVQNWRNRGPRCQILTRMKFLKSYQGNASSRPNCKRNRIPSN